MEPSTLVVSAIFLMVPVLAIFFIRRHLAMEAARKQAIEAKGWTYTAPSRGQTFIVEGMSGDVMWTLKGTPRSSNGKSGGQTVWESPAEPLEGVVLIGPKLPEAAMAIAFGGGLAQMLLRMVLGDMASQLSGASEQSAGTPALREKCSVIATTQELAADLLAPEVEQAILAANTLGVTPIVLRWNDRLQVRIMGGSVHTAAQVNELVEIGLVLAKHCGY